MTESFVEIAAGLFVPVLTLNSLGVQGFEQQGNSLPGILGVVDVILDRQRWNSRENGLLHSQQQITSFAWPN